MKRSALFLSLGAVVTLLAAVMLLSLPAMADDDDSSDDDSSSSAPPPLCGDGSVCAGECTDPGLGVVGVCEPTAIGTCECRPLPPPTCFLDGTDCCPGEECIAPGECTDNLTGEVFTTPCPF